MSVLFFGFALVRLTAQTIRGGSALRVDSSGIATRELSMTKKGGERSGQFTPWDDIDVIALQNERTSAAGADGFLCLYRQDPDGEVLLHRSKVTGWSLDLKKLSEIARQHSPDVQVTERYIRDD